MTSDLRVLDADLSQSRPPRWAWQDRLPLGYLSLILGNEGVGKGTLGAWMIARLTHGALEGDLRNEPINVAIIGDEDSFQDVWTPRLHAAGANLARVKSLDRPEGGYIELQPDRDRLASTIAREGIRFAYFDALVDNLGAGVNDWHGRDVRAALLPLREVARELDICTLGSLHPNKRGSTFRDLVSGSAAFNAVSRSSLLLADHPEDDTRKVLVRGKGNLSVTPRAVDFTIETYHFAANGYHFDVPRAAGFREGDLTVDELTERKVEHSNVGEAVEIIEALVPKDDGWHGASPVYDACAKENIEERTVKRAKQRLGLEHRRTRTFPAASEWRWPGLTKDTDRSSENAGPSVPSVPSADHKTPINNRQDTQDGRDSENDRPQRVPTAETDDDQSPDGAVRALDDSALDELFTEDDLARYEAIMAEAEGRADE